MLHIECACGQTFVVEALLETLEHAEACQPAWLKITCLICRASCRVGPEADNTIDGLAWQNEHDHPYAEVPTQ